MYIYKILSFPTQNIRIMAKYYTRITMKRMAGLLDLSIDVSTVLIIGSCKMEKEKCFYIKWFVNLGFFFFNSAILAF